jgi:hypothetical protein
MQLRLEHKKWRPKKISRVAAGPLAALTSGAEPIRPETVNSIILRLHRGAAMALWRAAEPDGVKGRDREVIEHRRGLLADGETLTEDGNCCSCRCPSAPASVADVPNSPLHLVHPPCGRTWRC